MLYMAFTSSSNQALVLGKKNTEQVVNNPLGAH